MPLVKCINGHAGCAAAERYLEHDGRAIGHDFINLDCMEREDGSYGWASEMDGLRTLYKNGEPYRGKPAITYRHYIVSPDPADAIGLERLRELSCAWARRHFGEYQVAIVYHDDNENRIPHAHIVVNNTNVETGRRLHVPNPKELNRDLQRMARDRGLGYLVDRSTAFERHAKGGEARTAQREFKGRAERRIEREGGYSWIADIRQRAKTARAIAGGEETYRGVLKALGIELTLNSPNARRRDYLYAFADHPTRKVSGEKLGWPYGKASLEREWARRSPLRDEEVRRIAERAMLVRDFDELEKLARAMETIKESRFGSIADIDRTIGRLEHGPRRSDEPRNEAYVSERLERLRQARQFAAKFNLLPSETPKPARTQRNHSSSEPKRNYYSEVQRRHDPPQQTIDRSRSGHAR